MLYLERPMGIEILNGLENEYCTFLETKAKMATKISRQHKIIHLLDT